MRKYYFILWIVFFLVVSPQVVFGADALYRMLHADEVDQFKEDQDALIVGQIIDKHRDKFEVKVLKVLSGKIPSDSILVSDNFNYGWNTATPSVNDYGVFSLKKSGYFYQKAWGIFEATSGDYQTLELRSLNASAGMLGDLACIQWYVNTGGKEKDFYFDGDTAYVRRPDGQVLQIYPVATPDEWARNSPTMIDDTQSNSLSYVLSTSVVLIGIGTVLFVRLRKGKKKQ